MAISARNTNSAVLEELGARLRRTRLDRNLNQAKLAEEAGIGRATLQRIEEGKSASLTNLISVLRALDLLDGLDRLVPEPSPSPIDELKRRGRQRRRAGSPRRASPTEPPRPWRWPDEDGS
ncbi:MAG: helix-turn-helix transcriptional regulator [Solirubrobacterales bacterium]|nr:helix-turn-helix transcriptional regulator [Solirubrobacterales bacterium]